MVVAAVTVVVAIGRSDKTRDDGDGCKDAVVVKPSMSFERERIELEVLMRREQRWRSMILI